MAKNKDITFDFNEKQYVLSFDSKLNKTIESRHLFELLSKTLTKTEWKSNRKITTAIKSIIPVMTNYCIGCQELLEYESKVFATCGKQKCLIVTEELLLDNYVIQYFKDNVQVAIFLIESAIDAMKSGRRDKIFEPFPKIFMIDENKDELERGKMTILATNAVNTNKNYQLIDTILSKYSVKELINLCQKTDTDFNLLTIIGDDWYKLLKFILKSNQTDIKPKGLFTMIDFNKFMQTQYSKTDKRSTSLEKQMEDFRQFEVNHPQEVEDKFQTEAKPFGTIYLYHGSSMENWYSILRNGLKITSGTQLMTAGAAYGNGIYLSSDIALSLQYAHGNNPTFGVYEVINDKSRYTQSNIIYVAKDEKMVILRYLFVLPTKDFIYTFALRDVMNTKFGISLHKEKKQLNIAVNNIKTKRLMSEYKKLDVLDSNVEGFYIEIPDETNFYTWNIFLTKFEGSKIEESMRKLGIDAIQLEVKFPEGYPLEPPFFRIIYPRFQFRTGHITSGGSICMELLTKKGWSSICSMESIIRDIKANIIEGEGQIDEDNYCNKYSIEEAKEAFNRMVKMHNWE